MKGGAFQMAQLGGTAGDILGAEMLDVPLDYDSMQKVGHVLGSGAILIMNDTIDIKAFLRRHNRHAEILETRHEPQYLERLGGSERQPLEFLRDLRVAALSGIAVPASFEGFLTELGAEIVARARFADHHRFSAREVARFMKRAAEFRAKAVIITEKDAVRYPTLRAQDQLLPVYFLRVEVRRVGPGEDLGAAAVRWCLASRQ